MRTRSIAWLALACVLPLSACSQPTPTPTAVSTPTTTSEPPGADQTAWFESYCGPMGVAALASYEPQKKAAEGMPAVKDAVVRWASLSAVSMRMAADGIEKLGPMGSDMQNPHERLIKGLRAEAAGYDDVAKRLQELAPNDVFPERYKQVMASRGGSADSGDVMFKQIASMPKYAETFRANKVCVDWQNLSGK